MPKSRQRKHCRRASSGRVLALEPVDELSVLTVCDNATDMLLPDEGPAKRLPLAGMGRQTPMLEAPTLREGKVPDAPLAQHGFSALVEVRKGSQVRRLLFDTGLTPDGCAENLRLAGPRSRRHRGHRLQSRPLRPHHRAVRPHRPARPGEPAGAHPPQRARATRTRRDRPRPLHRLESHPHDHPPAARRVHPEQRGHHLPSHRRAHRVGTRQGTVDPHRAADVVPSSRSTPARAHNDAYIDPSIRRIRCVKLQPRPMTVRDAQR